MALSGGEGCEGVPVSALDITYWAAIRIQTQYERRGPGDFPDEILSVHEFLKKKLDLKSARLALENGLSLIKEAEAAQEHA